MIFGSACPGWAGASSRDCGRRSSGGSSTAPPRPATRASLITDLLEDVPVSRLMRREPVVVYPELSLVKLVDEYLLANSDRAFPVVDGDHLVGIVTTEDVRKVRREDWAMTRVRQVMTPSRSWPSQRPMRPGRLRSRSSQSATSSNCRSSARTESSSESSGAATSCAGWSFSRAAAARSPTRTARLNGARGPGRGCGRLEQAVYHRCMSRFVCLLRLIVVTGQLPAWPRW